MVTRSGIRAPNRILRTLTASKMLVVFQLTWLNIQDPCGRQERLRAVSTGKYIAGIISSMRMTGLEHVLFCHSNDKLITLKGSGV